MTDCLAWVSFLGMSVKNPPPAGLGERIKRLRTLASLTSREVSEAAGMSRGMVSMLETGAVVDMTTANATALARCLGVTLEYLLQGDGTEPTARQILAAYERARAGVAA